MPAALSLRSFRVGCCLLAWALAGAIAQARADDLAQVRSLQSEGRLEQALREVRRLIEHRPNDPQYRLTEALILQQQHRDRQAIDVLRKLTLQYPELPEPYNNLGVIYAERGDYAQALEQLRMALHANPAYATASSNLGDLYVQLARQSYEQALRASDDPGAQQHARAALKWLRSAAAPHPPAAPAAPAAAASATSRDTATTPGARH